jgi:long-chain acyl-CoA synthetase
MIRTAAANLREMDVQKGDRVMLAAVPYVRFVAAYFACHYIGAVAVPVDKNAVKATVVWMKEWFETDFVFWEGDLVPELTTRDLHELLKSNENYIEAAVTLDEDDVADIILTSGSTGKPKGVMLTHENHINATLIYINNSDIGIDTRALIPTPLYHNFALRTVRLILYCGATCILENGFGNIRNIYTAIVNNNCTDIFCTPSAISVLYEQTKDNVFKVLGSLKCVTIGTASITLNMKEKLLKDLPKTNIYTLYGSTEASGPFVFINYRTKKDKLNSVGLSDKGISIRIIDNDYNEIQSNKNNCGRIAVSGNIVMYGYWCNKELTNSSIVNNWLIMNDLAYIDDDGYVYLIGRADDIINVGGEKVSPFEIENVITTFNTINECCCIAVSDPQNILGNVPVAFITLKDKSLYSEKLLNSYLQQRLEKYKLPYRIIVVDEIPKNAIGKFLRRELIRIWEDKR